MLPISISLITIIFILLTLTHAYAAGEPGGTTGPADTGKAQAIVLDGNDQGRVFEGIGALSAGAGSRLLIDYPEPQRSQILDFLFKPNFGASMHHLKVEIGGDVNSTEGSEPSYARTREEFEHPRKEYFDRGYEWWLMREAKKRNPKIYLDILQWGAPDWIGDKDFPDSGDASTLPWDKRIQRNRKKFFTQDNIDFIVGFIEGAKKYHGLDIDYCGTWNESPIGDEWEGDRFDISWIKGLRETLDKHGLTRVGIIARDLDGGRDQPRTWRIADLMEQDPELKNAIFAAGAHYPGRWSTDVAKKCGRPLWASEDSPGWNGCSLFTENPPKMGWDVALQMANLYNLNYIDAAMTKTITCYLIASYYDRLSFANASVIDADTPWSGYYEVWPPLWAMAHTGQFVQPGWKYLDGGCGRLNGGGTYVSLRGPETGGDYSVIIETSEAKAPQTVTFRVDNGLTAKLVHVWKSTEQNQFERQSDIRLDDTSFKIELEPRCIYSLTTTTGQAKGKAKVPNSTKFPTPYSDDFESYKLGKMAKYFADQSGTFEVAKRPDGGQCLRQSVAQRGIDWDHYPTPQPYTIIGSGDWRNYEVSCDAYIEGTGYVALFGRIACSLLSNSDPPHGYWLKVAADGNWELKAFTDTLASGTVAFDPDRWHKLALRFSGSQITAIIDGVEMKTMKDYSFPGSGMVGLGTGWNTAMFDNLSVREIAGPSLALTNLAKGKKATSSSDYNDSFNAPLATDGNVSTRWNAAVGDKNGTWLEVDFGQPTRFNRVVVRQLDQRVTKYKIQYLDGEGWRDAYTSKGAEPTAAFPSVQASKIRFVVVSTNPEASVFELEVYDDED